MGQLEDMAMFVRIVEAGGISKAAEQLDIAKSAVSKKLSDLEKRLATQLISRTTRKSNLTEVGEEYYHQCLHILEQVQASNEKASGNTSGVEGTLKMTAPLSFGLMHLNKIIEAFACRYPQLKYQLDFSDRHIDLVEEGYELGIRIGDLADSNLQARKITQINHVLLASPQYLQKHGTPKVPEDLYQHSFLQYSNNDQIRFTLDRNNKESTTIKINAKFKANNGDVLKYMAENHHGITYMPTFLLEPNTIPNKLVSVLPKFDLPSLNAYAVYPRNRFLSQRCRKFIDFMIKELGDTPYWDQYLN